MTAVDRRRVAARPLALLWVAAAASLAGCGQTGPLYLPDDAGTTVITRPGPVAATPAATDAATTRDAAAPSPAAPAPRAVDASPDASPDAPPESPASPTDKPPARR
jgi:predicted small lipoprotein YifL